MSVSAHDRIIIPIRVWFNVLPARARRCRAPLCSAVRLRDERAGRPVRASASMRSRRWASGSKATDRRRSCRSAARAARVPPTSAGWRGVPSRGCSRGPPPVLAPCRTRWRTRRGRSRPASGPRHPIGPVRDAPAWVRSGDRAGGRRWRPSPAQRVRSASCPHDDMGGAQGPPVTAPGPEGPGFLLGDHEDHDREQDECDRLGDAVLGAVVRPVPAVVEWLEPGSGKGPDLRPTPPWFRFCCPVRSDGAVRSR